jgi:hypothetical protein
MAQIMECSVLMYIGAALHFRDRCVSWRVKRKATDGTAQAVNDPAMATYPKPCMCPMQYKIVK